MISDYADDFGVDAEKLLSGGPISGSTSPICEERRNGRSKGERDLDRFIDSQARKSENEAEAAWRLSVAKYQSKRRAELRAEWIDYHERAARNILKTAGEIAREHRRRARELTGDDG